MIIDSHAHLNDPNLYLRAQEIYDGMEQNGLAAIVNVGYDEESSFSAVELAHKYDKFFAVVGLHPHDASKSSADLFDKFRDLAAFNKVLAIGEIGLDFHYDLSPRDVQAKVFIEQLELAYSLRLPTVIHLREGYGVMENLLKENAKYLSYGILLHCFSGSKEYMEMLSSRYDAYFSFGGAITFRNATDKPDIVRACPVDRMLLETDCPYMTPVPYRGKQNEPKYVNLVLDKVAEYMGRDRAEIEATTYNNTRNFFGRMKDLL